MSEDVETLKELLKQEQNARFEAEKLLLEKSLELDALNQIHSKHLATLSEFANTDFELRTTTNRLQALISNLQSGVLLEDEHRKILIVNKLFCEYFQIPVDPQLLVGADCSSAAEQSKGLFKDPELFVTRVQEILEERKLVIGEELELKNGLIFSRDYIPIYTEGNYQGHLWKYQDITEKKKADEKLTQQKEFYESVLNNIPTDIAVFDKDHRYLFLNTEAIKDPELRKWIIGKDDYEYMEYRGRNAAIADDRRSKFELVRQSKTLLKWEEELKDATGKSVYRLRHLCPVLDHNGEIVNVIGLGLDITNERLIRDELRNNEHKLKIINQISHELIINQDFETSIHNALNYITMAIGIENINIYQHQLIQDSGEIGINHRYGHSVNQNTYGIQDGNYQAIPLGAIMPDESQKQLAKGIPVRLNHSDLEAAANKIIHSEHTKAVIIFPIIVVDQLWGSIVFEYQQGPDTQDEASMDILSGFSNTIGGAIARKETEEKLKAIVTSLDDVVMQINKHHEYEDIWVSDSSQLRFEKQKYLKKQIADIVDPRLASMFERAIDEVLQSKEIRTFTYHIPETNEYYRCKICYLNTESVSVLVQDVTEQKRGEIELVKAREKAEQSVRAKEHFLANMSHEIRTPINAIMGMSKLLQKTTLNVQQGNYLNAISTSSKNLLVIINDILDFSKIESNKLVLEKIGFKLGDVVADVVNTIQYRAEEKNLSLSQSIDEHISPILLGDPARLNQILLNLVNNAIKFTNSGSIHIDCKLIQPKESEQHIMFSVQDTGIGISTDKLETIFESFTQEDESITRQYGGTGLGLSICKELVELQGGSIGVESIKNKGTRFFFDLSYEIGTAGQVPKPNCTSSIIGSLSGVKILLVEDNEINTFLAQTILENAKMEVDTAVNGLIAIDKLKANDYDLILMDMQMPIMGGVEASKIIRQDLKLGIPIIALTANAIKGDDAICIDAGMNDYVSKPFEEEELLRKIAQLLQKTEEAQIPLSSEDPKTEELYSLDKLKNLAKGNDTFVNKMVQMFIANTPLAISKIREHYQLSEYDKMKAIAHTIKPSINFLSISSILSDIIALETYSESIQLSHLQVNELIDKVEKTILAVVDDLKNDSSVFSKQ